MRFLLKLVLVFVFLVPLSLAGMVFLAVDDHPKINRAAEITPDNIGRAKRILDKNDPRNLKPGAVPYDLRKRDRSRPRGQLHRSTVRWRQRTRRVVGRRYPYERERLIATKSRCAIHEHRSGAEPVEPAAAF